MSWGATAYTPIIAYNEPPFGFAETITPPDFKTNNVDPWSSTDELKADLNARFVQLEKARKAEKFENEYANAAGQDNIDVQHTFVQRDMKKFGIVIAATIAFYYMLRLKDDSMMYPMSVAFQALYWFAVFLFLRR
jgi:hypothetical protein